jgi:hypothetical protein
MDWAGAFASWSPHELSGITTAMQSNLEAGFDLAKGWVTPIGASANRTPIMAASSAVHHGACRPGATSTGSSTSCRRCARTWVASSTGERPDHGGQRPPQRGDQQCPWPSEQQRLVINDVGGTTDGFRDERNRQRNYKARHLGGKQVVEHAVRAILTVPVRQSDRHRQQPRYDGEQRDASGDVLDPVKGFDHGPDHELRGRPRVRAVEHHDDDAGHTLAVSQATTAVQIAVSANEPANGTSTESGSALLRTTINGTTPMASTPTRPSTNGMLKTVICAASRSGSRLRIAANSCDSADRACRNDTLPGTPRW